MTPLSLVFTKCKEGFLGRKVKFAQWQQLTCDWADPACCGPTASLTYLLSQEFATYQCSVSLFVDNNFVEQLFEISLILMPQDSL